MKYLAHIDEDGNQQTVVEHLRNTSELCCKFAKTFGAQDQGRLIGLAHDIGKCSSEFQKRLQGGRIVDHASAGAFECAKLNAIWASGCVAGHHGGLPDFGNIRNDTSEDTTLFGRLWRVRDKKIPEYEVPFPLSNVGSPEGYGKDYLTDSFIIRMLYSCLVDADFLDTEQFMSHGKAERGTGESLPILLEKLNHYIDGWWSPKNDINRRRCEILRACIESGIRKKGLFTLTVPTGGGKTVASVAFALNHAVAHGMERIIYVIPYTSIIEQTASVFREIFGEENVIEHHSNASYEIREGDDLAQYKRVKATENWDAPIIVTTAVQFFESLYANRSSKCRKLHNIANSVLIFDEAQMLPTEHLRPCVAAVAKLVSNFQSTAVLCTATQPVLNDLFEEYASGYEIEELCPRKDEMFSAFRRVKFENIGEVDAGELSGRLAENEQVLCVVNSRKSAQEIFERLPEEGRFHLSTLMYPANRREVLDKIRTRLQEGKLCRVVSTSLIEAGVDVDFPAAFREMAGLDSILQAAGRCNREGKRSPDESIVTIFHGVSTTPSLLKVNIGATKEIMSAGLDFAESDTIQRYFKAYRSLAGNKMDREDVVAAFEEGIQGCSMPFRSVAESFRLINSNTKTVYIPLEKGFDLVERLRSGEHSRKLFRELGQYGVNIYENHYLSLMSGGSLEIIDEDCAVLMNTDLYSSEVGLALSENQELAIFA